MGARQVLRVAVGLALAATCASLAPPAARADERPAGAAAPGGPRAVGVVELRARPAGAGDDPGGERAQVSAAVGRVAGVQLPVDAALALALTGDDPAAAEARAADALVARAQLAFGEGRCTDARPLAAEAALAALSLGDWRPRAATVARLLAIELLCAHEAGDRPAAARAADRLRALGVADAATPPAGVPAEVWARYPEIDLLSNRQAVRLHLESDASGARAEVELFDVGALPVRVAVAGGPTWIIVHAGARRRAVSIDAAGHGLQKVRVELPAEPVKRWDSLAKRVSAAQAVGDLDAKSAAALMREANLVLMVVVMPSPAGTRAHVWRLEEAEGAARAVRVADVAAADGAAVERAVAAAIAAPTTPPGAQLAPGKQQAKPRFLDTRTGQLLFAGALLVGAVIVFVAAESGDTTQHIVVTPP